MKETYRFIEANLLVQILMQTICLILITHLSHLLNLSHKFSLAFRDLTHFSNFSNIQY